MSEIRISPSQPQAPAFTPEAPEAPAEVKPTSKPTSKSKASKGQKATSKASKATAANRQPLMLKSGDKGQCQILLNAGHQCSNPANYSQTNGRTTCRTHDKRISVLGLGAFRFTKVSQAYDKSLWGSKA